MNRSILIVICDFLLVSMLAFSSVDLNLGDQNPPPAPALTLATNAPGGGRDLAAAMRQALEEERQGHQQALSELQQEAARQKALLGEREKQAQTLQQQQTALQQQQAALQQQFALAQTNVETLTHQLQTSSSQALLSQENLSTLAAQLKQQRDAEAALQRQLSQLAGSNQAILSEKQQLAAQLQVAQVEQRAASAQAARLQDQVTVERAEKAKLAAGVEALATRSGELAKEVRDNRPLAPNTIFDTWLSNRLEASFVGVRPGLLGEATRQKGTSTPLVTDGTNLFALCHVQDTPLSFGQPGTEWDGLVGTLSHDGVSVPIQALSFSWPDPRVVWIPVSKTEASRLGTKAYRLSADPYKFQDAVLVGAREGYYGQCRFQIDTATPDYVKLDRTFLGGLIGKFNASRGDLVFSQQGELLGVMANNSYCLRLRSFDAISTLTFGQDVRSQHTSETLSRLYAMVSGLPFKLQ